MPVAEKKLYSSSWQGRNHTGCKHSPNKPCSTAVLWRNQMFVHSHPVAVDAFRALPKPSKEQTQLHSTFPIDNLCSGKCQWKEAHPLVYGGFSVLTWAVLHDGQNSMGRIILETMYFLLLHEVATISIEK